MKKKFVILAILTVIFSLWSSFLIAEEPGEKPKKDRDNRGESAEHKNREREQPLGQYNILLAELERQREENRNLKEEVRFLREEMFRLLSMQLDRQNEEIERLREMLEEQHDFTRRLLEREYEMRKEQFFMEKRDWRPDDREPNIERDIMRLEEELERRPNDLELRMKLAHVYREVDNMDAAIEQYKAALEIEPDFDRAFHELERLRAIFPDESRKPERPLEDIVGTIISVNKEEIKLEPPEGDAIVFKVPFRQMDDGSWALDEDMSELVSTLQPGIRVRIVWRADEDSVFIHRIEQMEEDEE